MKDKLTLANVLAMIPLGFLCLCGLFLGCSSGGGGSSSSSSSEDTTGETEEFTRTVRAIVDNNSGQAVEALLVFTDQNLANLDFVQVDVPVDGEETKTLSITSKELFLLDENVTIQPQTPPEDDPDAALRFFIIVNEETIGGSDIDYRVVVP